MELLKEYWECFFTEEQEDNFWTRKKELWNKRDAQIVQIKGEGRVYQTLKYDRNDYHRYLLHVTFLIKQGDRFHLEEQVIPYQFRLVNGKITDHYEETKNHQLTNNHLNAMPPVRESEERFTYDRRAAVQYAERWWNSYNPDYQTFDVDCTNYVSQCLYAGGAPMWGNPNREQGWWYKGDNWSFSWAVAHSLRWYLSGSTNGLKGTEVESPEELNYGDVICYDFEGDDRWDHNTIVTGKDAYGMPLVNAHTDNSRHRYWSYEDSLAWTENIKYKFFRIGE